MKGCIFKRWRKNNKFSLTNALHFSNSTQPQALEKLHFSPIIFFTETIFDFWGVFKWPCTYKCLSRKIQPFLHLYDYKDVDTNLFVLHTKLNKHWHQACNLPQYQITIFVGLVLSNQRVFLSNNQKCYSYNSLEFEKVFYMIQNTWL